MWKIVGSLLLVLASFTQARAQTYPDKNIRFIVPWPAGGAADAVGRLIAQSLTAQLGRTVFVENIAGASGNIGTQQFVRSPNDGYTLYLATSSTNVANPHLFKKLPFKPIEDFTPIALVAVIPSVLVVPSASPYNRPADLIAAAKVEPGKLSYASGGTGNSGHLAAELFKSLAGIEVLHVPYRGSGPAMNDVMGGQVTFMFDTGAFPYVKGGRVRAIAVAAEQRSPQLPDVPTFGELGLKDMTMNAWYGVAAPAGTSPAVVERVNAALNTALTSGDLKARLAEIGAEARGGSAAEFSAYWRVELDRYKGIVALTGATLD